MRRGARANARAVQRVPLTSGAGYEKDRIHRVAIRYARVVTPERMCRRFGQQRFDLHPQLVGNPPAVASCYQSHAPLMHDLDHMENFLPPNRREWTDMDLHAYRDRLLCNALVDET